MGSTVEPIAMVAAIHKLALYWRTVRHLKIVQIVNRVKRRVISVATNPAAAPQLRKIAKPDFYFIQRPKSYLGANSFNFLNKTHYLSFPQGWNDSGLPKLWIYNLHYFEGLLDDTTDKGTKTALIEQWIEENPPGLGNGWEPYPNSLRIVNWIKWALSGHSLSQTAQQSLAVQTRYLVKTLEFHLLGNHLFANAKALIFAGIFFDGREAQSWYNRGITILKEQIPEQFLADGAHFELSPTYHALLTEDLLDIIQLINIHDQALPDGWYETGQRAVNWLRLMTRPDGFSPLFNDAAYGITPTLEHILLLQNAVGLKSPPVVKSGLTDMAESGYFRYEADAYSFFGDAGQIGPEYLPGHAHCDMLSFELFVKGTPFIVDTGISTYDICSRRDFERSTAAHNTVQNNTREQSEIWGSFRVGRRAEIIERSFSDYSHSATCKSYEPSGYKHTRTTTFKEREITFVDTVQSRNNKNNNVARLHFHPDIQVTKSEGIIKANDITLTFEGASEIRLIDCDYAPEFNKLIASKALEISFNHQLETKIRL